MRLKIVLIVVGAAVGLFLLYNLFIGPLWDAWDQMGTLETEIASKRQEYNRVAKEVPKVQRWRQLSLPADTNVASREYGRQLEELLIASKVKVIERRPNVIQDGRGGTGGATAKKPVYVPVDYTIRLQSTLANLVKMLAGDRRLPLAQKIKSLTIEAPQERVAAKGPAKGPAKGAGKGFGKGKGQESGGGSGRGDSLLTVTIVLEALSIEGGKPFVDPNLVDLDFLNGMRRGLIGASTLGAVASREKASRELFPLATPTRDYADVARKNIFVGFQEREIIEKPRVDKPADPYDLRRFLKLEEITGTSLRNEAFLINIAIKPDTPGHKVRLRSTQGFDQFVVRDLQGEKELVKGKVVRIDPRDVYFATRDGSIYEIHIGENIYDAMRDKDGRDRKLSSAAREKLGLKAK